MGKHKSTIIKNIKRIIKEYGEFNIAIVEHETKPVVSTKENTVVLAEYFAENYVNTYTYVNGKETDENEIKYEDIDKNVLEDILLICENYETDDLKTLKRCSN